MMMIKKLLWGLFVIVVIFAFFKLLPSDLNITMDKVKEFGGSVTEFVDEQTSRVNPEDWPEPPSLLPENPDTPNPTPPPPTPTQ